MTHMPHASVARHLARRVTTTPMEDPIVNFKEAPLPEGWSDYLRQYLARGETHYTARPGIPALRSAIGREVHERGGPKRDVNDVIVTHGEGEALYVTLLGLGLGAESTVIVSADCRHTRLFDLLGIERVDPSSPEADGAGACYRESPQTGGSDGPADILALGHALFSEDLREIGLPIHSDSTIMIGDLDSLPGLDSFRLGYVAGPADLVKRIQTWKQALSICTAAPSQRAAVFFIAQERAS